MHVNIKPSLVIDTDLLEQQRELIGRLVANLEDGRTGIAIRRDLDGLLGIQGTLDAIGNTAERAASIDPDAFADLAKKVVDGYDLEACMEAAETNLYEFWSDPEGVDDYERCKAEHAHDDSFSYLDQDEDDVHDEYPADDGMGPDCPGCTTLALCDDCEYTADVAVDPVCKD